MAALVGIVYSLVIDILQISKRCSQFGLSIDKYFDVIKNYREDILMKRYLEKINEFYDNNRSRNFHSIGIECVNCRKRNKSLIRSNMCDESVLGYVDFESADEAFEVLSDQLCEVTESQTKLITENGAAYTSDTPVVMKLGSSFYVTGRILKNCEGFAINLSLGHTHNDIALHVNPRLPQNYIVRNTKINGRWAKEEVTSSLPFLLKRGERFAIQILVTESSYLISVNGFHFTTYAHRIPYDRVTCVRIVGDICDVKLEQLPIMEYPERSDQSDIMHNIPLIETFDKSVITSADELVMPFYGKLARKLYHGSTLHIVARVKVLPHSFYVNLQESEKIWPHPTIAFHLNPRFTTIGGKHVIVMNSWIDSGWGSEERRAIHTDFMPSRTFHMRIESDHQGYYVYLNDKFLVEYTKRVDPTIVDTIYIHGDIKLKHVSQVEGRS